MIEKRKRALAWVRRQIRNAGGPEQVGKALLAELAEKAEIEVRRSDGKKGNPTKADYLEALDP